MGILSTLSSSQLIHGLREKAGKVIGGKGGFTNETALEKRVVDLQEDEETVDLMDPRIANAIEDGINEESKLKPEDEKNTNRRCLEIFHYVNINSTGSIR